MIRYIGLTSKSVHNRLREHIKEAVSSIEGKIARKNTYRYNWLALNKDFIEVDIVEEVLSREEAVNKEVFYIDIFLSKGAKLVNTVHGPNHYKDGYKLGEEARANIRASRNNPITLEAQRQAILGHEVSLETRLKISNSLKGRTGKKHSEEAKKKMSEAKKLRDLINKTK